LVPHFGKRNCRTLVAVVFARAALFEKMKATDTDPLGFAFALSRVVARCAGRKPRRAEFSGAEAYGLGLLVFGISCVFVARALLLFVRPMAVYLMVLLILPIASWIAFLLLYYLNSLVIAILRRLRLYSAVTNNPFQHVVIMLLISLIALSFLFEEPVWVKPLGIFWLGLLSFNLISILIEKLLDEA